MTFNLVHQPWIPVLGLEGEARTVSLRQCFEEAGDIRRIGGELPTQAFALLRLLLAIAHDAVGFHSEDDIEGLHHKGIDGARVVDYLQRHEDRFDLFHPERPFFQVADLRTAKGEVSGLEKLISDVPNGHPFMVTRGGPALRSIPAAEAAVWLVHCQAFDPSGIRSGAVGDPLVTGGKGYPIGPAWAGQIGGVVLHGPDLARTLVLNIVPTPRNPEDIPVWAKPQRQTAERSEDARPNGPVELLVWQSRRIRLAGDATGVTGVVLSQGDRMTPQNRQELESMTAWRFSEPQTKKHGIDVYMPLKHDPNRSGWRGAPQLLAPNPEALKGKARSLPPGTVEYLRYISSGIDHLSMGVEMVGMDYGPQEATVADLVHDTLDLRTSLLAQEAAPVVQMLFDAVARTDEAVRVLGRLGSNLARAAGDFEGVDGAADRARTAGWAALDQPARQWISTLGAETDSIQAHREWQGTTREVLQRQARLLLDNATPAAVQGRGTNYGFMSAARAEIFFRSKLREVLPLAHEDRKKDQPS